MNPSKLLKRFNKVHNSKRTKREFTDRELKHLIVRAMFCDLIPTLNMDANLYKLKLEYCLCKKGVSVHQWDTVYEQTERDSLFEEAHTKIVELDKQMTETGELRLICKELGFDESRL